VRREFITLLGAASAFFCVSAAAQEGYYGNYVRDQYRGDGQY
jgi:hypothetical protein